MSFVQLSATTVAREDLSLGGGQNTHANPARGQCGSWGLSRAFSRPLHRIHALLQRERRIQLQRPGRFRVDQDVPGREEIHLAGIATSSAQSVLG